MRARAEQEERLCGCAARVQVPFTNRDAHVGDALWLHYTRVCGEGSSSITQLTTLPKDSRSLYVGAAAGLGIERKWVAVQSGGCG